MEPQNQSYSSILELVLEKAKEIEEALKSDCLVMIGSTVVKTIEVKPTRRSVIILINGVQALYPSEFIRKKVIKRCE